MLNQINITSIVGARPHFIKMLPFHNAIEKFNRQSDIKVSHQIVHTGQHYDQNMSEIFFNELNIPSPNKNLNIGSGSQAEQTAKMLVEIEKTLIEIKQDVVMVYGDTNTTLAGSLAASKLHIPLAHVEAGLRSFNRKMPEELNRTVVDHLADILFAPTNTAMNNLQNEGCASRAHLCGDIMYDAILNNQIIARDKSKIMNRLELVDQTYALATIHRAENTDDVERLKILLDTFNLISEKYFQVILPIHPRTAKVIKNELPNWQMHPSFKIIEPLSYLDLISTLNNAAIVLTDSGGLQKEAFMMNKPCITLRDQTEWVEIVDAVANIITGVDSQKILDAINYWEHRIKSEKVNWTSKINQIFGDGNAAEIILEKTIDFVLPSKELNKTLNEMNQIGI